MKPDFIEQKYINQIFRRNFKGFLLKVFKLVVTDDKPYNDNWHIDLLVSELMDMLEGKQNRLIINIPPRYLKSVICSIALPAFILGLNPTASIICVSYSDDFALKLANDCKRVMESDFYKELFPKTRLSTYKKAAGDFETTQGGGRFATSISGAITGRGGDWLIIDDPIKAKESRSDLLRESVNDWYSNSLYSRLNDKKTGKILVVMQRLHEDDLTGHILELDSSYKQIRLPVIAETDEEWKIRIPISNEIKIVKRKKGELLHPEREDAEVIEGIKINMLSAEFHAQYQQSPKPMEGTIIKSKWIRFYNKEELFKLIHSGVLEVSHIIQSWDAAYGTDKKNDFSACITAIKDTADNFYICAVNRVKYEFPDLVKEIVRLEKLAKDQYQHSVDVLIENKGPGKSLIQELKRNHKIDAREINTESDKKSRLIAISHLIENGKCKFPDDSPYWWLDFEKELLTFPNSKHDDQCDALSQALSAKLSVRVNARVL